jgi:hypothetical protein
MTYEEFIESKSQLDAGDGFEPLWVPDFLFDFQKHLVNWNIRKGRSATFADCGLGKTPMQLVIAENVVRKTNKRVIILTPLAVSAQTIREAEKFGIEAVRSREGQLPLTSKIVVTNYEQLHYYEPRDYIGCVADESSILKNFAGARRKQITAFIRKMPYRLLCTATAAPNDYIELGTSSEALGYLDYPSMLTRFFREEANLSVADKKRRRVKHGQELVLPKWVFKSYAEVFFWRWTCSWARCLRKPSDLGFNDDGFILPALRVNQHMVKVNSLPEGKLLHVAAVTMREQLEERRRTIHERCEKAAELACTEEPVLVWCNLNPEGDLLEKLIPDCVQISGSDPDEVKEERWLAFITGQARVVVTKHKIGAFGLNLQHCAHEITFPTHSWESYYQAVHRCQRFGQKRPVTIDIVTTEAERDVMANLQRKQIAADEMFEKMLEKMAEQLHIKREVSESINIEVPEWMKNGNGSQISMPSILETAAK